eukprot:6858779-Prymnesium_polylepis.1
MLIRPGATGLTLMAVWYLGGSVPNRLVRFGSLVAFLFIVFVAEANRMVDAQQLLSVMVLIGVMHTMTKRWVGPMVGPE